MRNRLTRSATAALLAGALVPGTAAAASFYIIESSPARLGNAFSGTASEASDASTVYFNPAGMARLEDRNITAAGHHVMPRSDFNDDGSTGPAGNPMSGEDGNTDESALVPNFYYAMPVDDRLSFGVAVNAPFGLTSDWGEDWKGRYHATNSELTTVNLNPTLSYRVNDRVSIGAGISYQPLDATLENQLDSFVLCRSGGGSPAQCSSTQGSPQNASNDSSLKIEGDDEAFGFNLGLLYEVDANTRFGISYRSGADYTIEGTSEFTPGPNCTSPGFCAGAGATLDADVRADLELPDIVTLSASHALNDNWAISGDFAWYGWSVLDEVRIERKSDGSEVSTLELDYEDTTRVSVGATYSDGGPWTWRGGVAHDESPISSADTVTPRIPDGDRTWLSFGFNYALSPDSSLDFGYSHIFVDETKIDNTNSQGHTLKGEFDPTVDIVAVSGNWRF